MGEWLPDGRFDLVTCLYPGMPSGDGLGGRIMELVAPGGRFLGIWHGPAYVADARDRGFDPDEYLQPEHVLPNFEGWAFIVDELRRQADGDGEDRIITARRKPD